MTQSVSETLQKAILAAVAFENLSISSGGFSTATRTAEKVRTRFMNGSWPELEKLTRKILANNPNSKRAIEKYYSIFGVTDDEVLKLIAKSPMAAWEHAMQQSGPSPDLEDQILKTGVDYVCRYVGRFYPRVGTEKINQAMSTDPRKALRYAMYGLDNRFPQGESSIRTDPKLAITYAQEVLKGSWSKKANDTFTDAAILRSKYRTVYQGWLNKIEPDRLDTGERLLRWIKSVPNLNTHKIRSSRVERDGEMQYRYYLTPGGTRIPGANGEQIEQYVLDQLKKSTYRPEDVYYQVMTQYGTNNSNTDQYTRIDLIVEFNSPSYSY